MQRRLDWWSGRVGLLTLSPGSATISIVPSMAITPASVRRRVSGSPSSSQRQTVLVSSAGAFSMSIRLGRHFRIANGASLEHGRDREILLSSRAQAGVSSECCPSVRPMVMK